MGLAPGGVAFDTPDQIAREGLRIHQQVVATRIMPIGNLTNMTDDERTVIEQWYRDGASIDLLSEDLPHGVALYAISGGLHQHLSIFRDE